MRAYLIVTVIVILFVFATEGQCVKCMILGRIGNGRRMSGGRSGTSWQRSSSSSSRYKTGWNLPLYGYAYYAGSMYRNGNPTSQSEFSYGNSRTNTESRYSTYNSSYNASYNQSEGYPEQSKKEPTYSNYDEISWT
ncbi:PREDICTED: uncharacterized protein LOC105570182 [Vollenhovia emeryi]|uniref:uncharacterized protein LOC105570182 n=1 Tax=Vollenhovia emeryi TaxID=411798 RepID=UPI0005F4E255|nr:PREDICTED: uncharacterized protein LOC105570182 [Vollenhovia emeryi]